MQEQRTLRKEPAGARTKTSSQAQATEKLRGYRLNRIILGAVAGLGLVVASILGIQALTNERVASETRDLSPVQLVQEDPPLPVGWVDPYFDRPAVIPIEEDPPLPEGWVDPYFQRTD